MWCENDFQKQWLSQSYFSNEKASNCHRQKSQTETVTDRSQTVTVTDRSQTVTITDTSHTQ